MACNKCSKIRCKVYGFVVGAKAQMVGACFDGTACKLTYPNGNNDQYQFGDSFDTLGAYLKDLGAAALARVKRITLGK